MILIFAQVVIVLLLSISISIYIIGTEYSVTAQVINWPPQSLTEGANKPTIVLKISDNLTSVVENSKVVFSSYDSAMAIQKGLDLLPVGMSLLIESGTYHIDSTIVYPKNSLRIMGEGNSTILKFYKLGIKDTVLLSDGSHISNLKLEGSKGPLPEDFSQRIITENNVVIDNIVISDLGYGIETAGKSNISLTDISCDSIKSKMGWAACVHAGKIPSSEVVTRDLLIKGIKISDSNRGIELDAISEDVLVEDGVINGITNDNFTRSEPFSLDTHSHDGEGNNRNVTFRNVILKDSYGPSVKVASRNNLYSPNDLPRDVVYENITVINPKSSWQVNGDNVTIRNSRIINSTNVHAFVIYKNTMNLLIENIEAASFAGNYYFITNPESAIGIHNISIVNNMLYDSKERDGPIIYLHDINGLIVTNNTVLYMLHTDRPGSEKFNLHDNYNSLICDNRLVFVNRTQTVLPQGNVKCD